MSKADQIAQPFVRAARAQTMLRDFAKLREEIRATIPDPLRILDAWEPCERWVDLIDPNAGPR